MPKKTKIIFITTFIILAIFFLFNNETLAAVSFKIIPVVTKDSVSITINCPLCVQQTPGYIKITNTSGSVGNGQKSFTSLKDTLVFNGLQLGSTYNVQAVATDSKKPFYSDPNDVATVPSSFKVPLNLDPNSPTTGNTTPLKVDVVKSGTTATISVTCNNQCNGLRGSATVTGDNYNKTSPTEKSLVVGIPNTYTFDGLEAGKTYSVSGKPYLPNGIIYTWGTSFTMDAVNNGPATVNADIPVDPVAITGTPSPANFGIYNLLAPIGNFKSLTSSDNIGTYFNTIFLIAIGLCGVLAVIMFIIGGIQYMGDESIFGKTKGKEQMESAILGLLIALGSYALLNTINPDLLGGKGMNIAQVSAEITPLYDRGANDPKQANGESTRCTPVTSGLCSVANLTTVFGAENAVAMSKICNMESGGTSASSHTDICKPGNNAFSFGLFQVNLASNGILAGSDCVGLFDRSVKGSDAISPKYTSGFTCSLLSGKETLYNTCKNRLLDPATNLAIAKKLFTPSKNNWVGDKRFCASAFQ